MAGEQEKYDLAAGVFLRWTDPRVLGALVLSWIGLAGLADNVVEWKHWFEVGWMQHWRIVKEFIVSLLPFKFPTWVIDYMALGAAYFRTWSLISTAEKRENRDKGKLSISLKKRVFGWVISLLGFTALYATWPFWMCGNILSVMNSNPSLRKIGLLCIGAVTTFSVTFLIFLFLVSDALYTFGLAQRAHL